MNNSYRMKPTIANQQGSVLLVVLSVLLMASLIGMQMFLTADTDVTLSFNNQDATKALYSAESGIALAQSQLWAEYVNWASTNPQKLPGEIGNRESYAKFLDLRGITDGATVNLVSDYSLGEGTVVENVDVTRYDLSNAVNLTVTSTGKSNDNASQTISAVYVVEGEAFKGFEFAILANNINCIMCHATFDNTDRFYNSDNALKGTFDRVKIASLESMLLRADKADSRVAGTIYTRGIVTDKSGNPITNLSPTGAGLEGFAIDTIGKIVEPMNTVNFTNTTGSPLPQYGNLYLNYPTESGDMTDGDMPTTFPPPFPDGNNNKIVDDNEFNDVATSLQGSVSGGIIYGVPSGATYSSGSLPGSGNMASISQKYTGNLILVGTDAKPIKLDRDIAVDGDVIIQGKVEGTGQIYARGNIYVTGDMTYADGTKAGNRTYGVANNGTRNALSLAAGGNIMVGDYATPKKGDIADNTSIDPGNLVNGENFSFAMSEVTLFNRGEWSKTQQFLPDASGGMVANSGYISGYTPRYYTMNEGDPVYIFNKNDSKNKGTYFDPVTNSWKGKEHLSGYDLNKLTMYNSGDPALSNATITTLNATKSWISTTNLKNIWIDNDNNRTNGEQFKIDGQLYTNNSIFALTRKASNTNGTMLVNGALVASDVGVLVGNGLQLNYDQRLKSFLKIKDEGTVGMKQVAWYAQ